MNNKDKDVIVSIQYILSEIFESIVKISIILSLLD